MIYVSAILLIMVCIGMLSLFFKLLKKPLRWALKLFLNAIMGFVALFFINILGAFLGFSLGINWINAIVTGVFGLPGVVLLLLIKYIL